MTYTNYASAIKSATFSAQTLGDKIEGTDALWLGGATTGTPNTYALSVDSSVTAYAANQIFIFTCHSGNTTGANTLNVNSIGAKSIHKYMPGVDLVAGDLKINGHYIVRYDGTQLILLNPSTNILAMTTTVQTVVSTTTETTLLSYTLKGNFLNSYAGLEFYIAGEQFNNFNAADNVAVRVKYGGNLVMEDINATTTDTIARSYVFIARMWADASTTAQRAEGFSFYGTGLTTTDTGTMQTVDFHRHAVNESIATTSSSDQTILITADPSSNSASLSYENYRALIRIL